MFTLACITMAHAARAAIPAESAAMEALRGL